MFTWSSLLYWMLVCLFGHIEGPAKLTLNGPRTRIVLTGHQLLLNFTVTVPRNTTHDALRCYRGNKCVTPEYNLESDLKERNERVEVVLMFNHSSDSGEYRCSYKSASLYLAILARDEGFTERYRDLTDNVIAPMATLTVLLLIFSTLGSVYIYKSQAPLGGHGDNGTNVTRIRTSQGGDAGGAGVQDATDEEAAPDNSVYTTLESRPASIYDVLDPSASNSRTQSKKSSRKRSQKKDEVAPAEDGIFESVYENL
ncbi:uncharacterized protein LOC121717912 isoform X3 [Alosa sapidissima]|uniref:uncharacterized protein LOC121717912 isoform X3 n=1 Tax=Alosa sapidissima TaxID=34773 RepID=UPI001C092EE8|nr:uncharacterized protein LOC121717912 isoform X3 [Alosa sapidissima]